MDNAAFQMRNVTEGNFKDIPSPCRYCLYWQTNGEHDERNLKPENDEQKREWFVRTKEKFGECLSIAYLDNVPIGFAQYAPAGFFPRVKEYSSAQPSQDAVFIACLYIASEDARGKELGRMMLQDLQTKLKKKGVKSVETFARRSSANNPSGPLSFYLRAGFKTKDENQDFPLTRLEL
jgi:ribosomal protein S18 acetylase RimI-like enzyme